MNFRTVVRHFAPAALLLLATGAIQASPINGALPLVGINVTQNAADLSLSTMIFTAVTSTSSPGTGDYLFIPVGTSFGGPSTLNYTTNATLSTFTFGNAVWGTFAATNNAQNQVVQKTANFLDVFIVGIFTPESNAGWTGKDPTESSLRFSINQSGAVVSEAITLNSPALPPPGVPEPATLALMGAGLVGLGLFGRNRLVR